VTGGPARGLPPRIYLPILFVTALAFLGIVGYFLKIGLGVTGAALGPSAATDTSASQDGTNGVAVGGGTPAQAAPAGPPPMVQRLLVELRGRVARNPRDAEALASLASLYLDAGKYDEAQGYDARALAVAPRSPEALFDAGAIASSTGHRSAAIAAFRSFLRVAPNDERSPQVRDALTKLGA